MILFTDDLLLRTVTNDDVSEVARMWNFEKGCISKEEAQRVIENMRNNHKKNKDGQIYHLCLAVFEKNMNRIIGWCGLDGKTADKLYIFYLIDKAFRNRGYATQCAWRLLSYAFETVDVPFINGGCDKENTPSYRVMEKIGMLKDGFQDNGDPIFFIDRTIYQFGMGYIK